MKITNYKLQIPNKSQNSMTSGLRFGAWDLVLKAEGTEA